MALLQYRNFHRALRLRNGMRGHAFGVTSSKARTLYPSSRSASSMPPWRSPTVAISLRSTPIVTSVCAISGDRPVTITVAPSRRDASTVCTRWFATFESMAATPVMSIATTFARLVRIARSSCSVSWRARWGSITPMMGRMSSRSRTCSTGVENAVQLVEVFVILAEQRARQHVAQQQHDADDFMRLDAARNDALRQVARVGLQRLERPRLQRLDVVVVHRRHVARAANSMPRRHAAAVNLVSRAHRAVRRADDDLAGRRQDAWEAA